MAATTRPATGITPAELAREVDAVDLDRPLHDAGAALAEIGRLYLRDAVWFHEPTYLAHLNCPVVIPAVQAEAVIAAVNSSLDTWDQSAGGTLIEQRLIDWTAARIGFPAGDGVFTSGGTQSNLQGLLLAREEACARLRGARPDRPRLPELLGGLRVFASDVSHFSVCTSAALLGLGEDAVVEVPTDEHRRMRPDALADALARCAAEGLTPMAVVATAGTTDFGSIDPLTEVAALCAATGTWLHVDAAYGGGLLVAPRRRPLLAGIELADSVTVDFHKTFFQPVSSSALLVRDPASLRHVTFHADYLNPAEPVGLPVPNQVDKSLQTTRRFDALKLWTTLRVMGADAVGELFEQVVDLAAQGWVLLAEDPRLEVVVRPQLSTLVFRYVPARPCPPELVDQLNRHVRAAVAASGQAVLGGTTVDGRAHLKVTLLNPETTIDHLADVFALVRTHAEVFLAGTPGGVPA
ncbi:pyridoxal-dependent decarboxylase [Modestobacter sp. I12A-02628]|uniref:Aspartate aminotransferase family protein n=2 Tax=Goekera deserti TaxID=2497753 RepID=A0A7K3WBU4_9ACTN|nr:pyridoxal-dependent decarboxylase [Goekera deserti]NDI48058.1 pyridoxal-dependent decarboxylase [Goekera deserti]NEL53807.1 aspartate aminotransferase family protein [Goekera deserti]